MLRCCLVGLLIILLIACSGQETPQLESQIPTPTPEATEIPQSVLIDLTEPISGNLTLPVVEDLQGRLAFVYVNTLYLGGFNGQSPTKITEKVNPKSISISPSGNLLVFSASPATAYDFFVYELRTGETQALSSGWFASSTVLSWSPASDWVIIGGRDSKQAAVRIDGAVSIDLPASGIKASGWLTDNKLLTTVQNPDNFSRDVAIYDLETGDKEVSTEIFTEGQIFRLINSLRDFTHSSDIDSVMAEQGLLYRILNFHDPEQNMVFVDNFDAGVLTVSPVSFDVFTPSESTMLHPCSEWSIVRKAYRKAGLPESYYVAKETALLSDLTLLPDESVLFLRWYVTDCSAEAIPDCNWGASGFSGGDCYDGMQTILLRADLIHAERGSLTSTVVAANLTPTTLPDFLLWASWSRGFPRENDYAASPDGRYVVWRGVDGAIYITDILTGAAVPLLIGETDKPFQTLFWVQ